MSGETRFPVVFLGYDKGEVENWLLRADEAANRRGSRRRREAIAELGEPAFHVRPRGYARRAVDTVVLRRWAELNPEPRH